MIPVEPKQSKHRIRDEIPVSVIDNWQTTVDFLAEIAEIPAALIVRAHAQETEVFVSSRNPENPYSQGEKTPPGTGRYCDYVVSNQRILLVKNALQDPEWDHSPDTGMISYCGLPINWPNGEVFGALCILDSKENAYDQKISHLMACFRDSIQVSLAGIYESGLAGKQRMAAQLAANEARLKAIFKTASDSIHILNTQGTLVEANDAFLCSIGYDSSWIGRLKAWDWASNFTLERAQQTIAKLIDSGDVMNIETPFRHRDGHEFWVALSVHVFRIDGESFIYSSSRDITERKLAQDRLRESELRFRNIVNASSLMIWVSGPDKQCSWFSQAWLNFTGISMERALENGWMEGVHPQDVQHCIETQAGHFDLRESFRMEYRLMHRSGEYRWVVGSGEPRFDDAGEFLGYVGSCADINLQKKTQDTLRLSASVFENAREVMIVTDAERKIISVNKSFTKFTGYRCEEVRGKDPSMFKSGIQPDNFYLSMWKCLAEDGIWSGELWNYTKGGELYAQLLSITVIKDELGKVAHYVGVATNFTSLKDYQLQLEGKESV